VILTHSKNDHSVLMSPLYVYL